MSLIPLPYRLLILAVLAAACFVSGFVLGMDWESNARDSAELKKAIHVITVTKEIVKERIVIETKFIKRALKREAEQEKIVQEVDKHVETIADPRDCWLAPERVRVINDAVDSANGGRVEADAVPAAKPTAVGLAQPTGAVGGQHGLQVREVLRKAFGTVGDRPVGSEAPGSQE